MRQLVGSLERTLALLNAIGDGINAQDRDGKLIYVNEAIVRMAGFPSAEAMLATTQEELAARVQIFDEAGTPVPLSQMPGQVTLTGEFEPERVVRTYNRITAVEQWVAVKAQPVFGDNGEVEFTVTITRDITVQKKQQILQEFLIEASKTLASSLEYETTLANVAHLVTPKVADWCAIDLVDKEGNLKRVVITHVDPAKMKWGYELQRRFPIKLEEDSGVHKVIRTGQTEYYPIITDAALETNMGHDPELLLILQKMGLRSVAVVPVWVQSQ